MENSIPDGGLNSIIVFMGKSCYNVKLKYKSTLFNKALGGIVCIKLNILLPLDPLL